MSLLFLGPDGETEQQAVEGEKVSPVRQGNPISFHSIHAIHLWLYNLSPFFIIGIKLIWWGGRKEKREKEEKGQKEKEEEEGLSLIIQT